jgi:hypothetical protein
MIKLEGYMKHCNRLMLNNMLSYANKPNIADKIDKITAKKKLHRWRMHDLFTYNVTIKQQESTYIVDKTAISYCKKAGEHGNTWEGIVMYFPVKIYRKLLCQKAK